MGTNTGIGIGIGIPFKNNALGGDRPYLPPELKARLIGVWDNYGKKNTDADRNIIKNKIPNAGGDLEILNAAYKLNSGFGEYKEDFTSWRIYPNIEVTDNVITTNGNFNSTWFIYKHANENEINEMNIKVSGIPEGGIIRYFYIPDETATIPVSYNISEDGVYHLPKSKLSSNRVSIGFTVSSSYDWNNIRIEQLSDFGGAFVTDGVNDMIISQKTIAEMGITDKVTIVSMIHQITLNSTYNLATTNYIENSTTKEHVRTDVYAAGKTGIYGYTTSLINSTRSTIGYILGDIRDYRAVGTTNKQTILDSKFSVVGRVGGFAELSSVAHYWTFAVLGIATADEINLIIAKYNLDRTLRPDILCNITKQGITNDNHADFNDKLIDYSGNGRDIQMYNLAWKGGSGIAAKQYESLKDWIHTPFIGTTVIRLDEFSYNIVSNNQGYWQFRVDKTNEPTSQIRVITDRKITWVNNIKYKVEGESSHKDKYKTTIIEANTPTIINIAGFDFFDPIEGGTFMSVLNYGQVADDEGYTLTILPSCKGGILLDGINDFGKVIGMPIYKDYTFIIEREFLNETFLNQVCLVSKSKVASEIENGGAFIVDNISVNSIINPYSFYKTTSLPGLNTFDRQIVFQSKHKYLDKDIAAGTSTDSDTLWLGTFRDNDQRFLNGAIYSLMSFPYSMSKFLIERQLKKHKLGTLYPNMVEFRPVIKANANYNIFYTALLPLTGNIWERINIGDYVPVGRRIAIQMSFDNEASELVSAISSQLGNISITKNSNNKGYTIFGDILKNKSPQKINITIDEYIRYEDIVQPYPVLLRFNDENGNEVSWGGKFRIGSTITRIGSAADSNLLPNIYNIFGLLLNDNQVTSSKVIVEKTMVFKAKSAYIFDNNEPNCILSPRLLRIPNSSYKILGYIPDISGHGNHGVIHNSAYKLNSGANGYLVDFTTLRDYGNKGIVRTDSKIYLDESFDYDKGFWLGYTNSPSPTYKVRVSGIPKDGVLNYTGGSWINLINGINELPARTNTEEIHGFVAQTPNVDWSKLVIEQIGEYEGAYCLDGIDDFITIPTLSKGGKQVLMKVNWSTLNGFIYDQRPASGDKTFGIYAQGDVIAYSQHNNGNTYIDGIINNNIIGNNLSKITHNIVATCDVDNSITPSIGKRSYSNSYFAQMSLYDFMLFDEISTDDKIKELNTYIGITPKVTLPNYYWDNYGKKNTDANKGYIDEQVSLQKTSTSVNPLENFNIGYEGMSGYNGYPVVLGANKTWETSNAVDYIYDINSTIVHITNVKHAANGLLYSYVKKDGALANIKEIPAFRVTVKGLEGNSKLIYKYLATENATKESIVYLGNGIHKLHKSFVPTDALLDLTTNSWIGFAITPMIEGELVFDCDITIEVLPEYENGLAYDGVSDFTDNKNIPIFTDFTAIIKRVDLDAKNDNSTVMFKGNKIYESSIGNGFILDYCYNSKNYVYSYGKLNQIERDDSKIIYLTPESYNGNPIIKGENEDNLGLVLGKYWKGIIYKTILYSKTISLLEINFLKNLMEKDEIIDINHPIFISNTEDESNTSQDT